MAQALPAAFSAVPAAAAGHRAYPQPCGARGELPGVAGGRPGSHPRRARPRRRRSRRVQPHVSDRAPRVPAVRHPLRRAVSRSRALPGRRRRRAERSQSPDLNGVDTEAFRAGGRRARPAGLPVRRPATCGSVAPSAACSRSRTRRLLARAFVRALADRAGAARAAAARHRRRRPAAAEVRGDPGARRCRRPGVAARRARRRRRAAAHVRRASCSRRLPKGFRTPSWRRWRLACRSIATDVGGNARADRGRTHRVCSCRAATSRRSRRR